MKILKISKAAFLVGIMMSAILLCCSSQVQAATTSVMVAGGWDSAYALNADGTIDSWGYNSNGQLGNNSTASSSVPIQVSDLTGIPTITAIACGHQSGYALDVNGNVWSWGSNTYGQLGNNSTASSSVPVQVSALTGMPTITAIAANYQSAYALDVNGNVWAWGYNNYGQLGNNSTVSSHVPVQVANLTGITAIACSQYSGYALSGDGTVWSWGYNNYGQLGNNSTTNSLIPVQVSSLTIMPTITAIACGQYSVYALDSGGDVWSWGYNSNGRLGNNSTTNSHVPVQVSNLTGITAIAGGYSAGYALDGGGNVWAWGVNQCGELGDASTLQSNVPVQVSDLTGITAIAGGNEAAYAIDSDGAIWSWGRNNYGQLGNLSTANSSIPVQVINPYTEVSEPTTPSKVVGSWSSAYALHPDGTIKSWGYNNNCQLGNKLLTNSSLAVQVYNLNLVGVTDIAAGNQSAYALNGDGTIWSWGSNTYGQLGNNSTTNSPVPVQVSFLTGITAIAANYQSVYALDGNGNVWSWGSNTYGQLGNNSTTNSRVPVQVSNLTGITAIACSQYSAYALDSDGTVWSWGSNNYGQLGNNSTTNSRIPVQVSNLTEMPTITAIACGQYSVYALDSDGTVWSWGYNSNGRLGYNPVHKSADPLVLPSNSCVPEQVNDPSGTGPLTDITAIAGGYSAGYALDADGDVWAWGVNQYGELGNQSVSTPQSNVPVQVSDLTGITAIAGGKQSAYAIDADGIVWSWGYNNDGQLGNLSTASSPIPVQVINP